MSLTDRQLRALGSLLRREPRTRRVGRLNDERDLDWESLEEMQRHDLVDAITVDDPAAVRAAEDPAKVHVEPVLWCLTARGMAALNRAAGFGADDYALATDGVLAGAASLLRATRGWLATAEGRAFLREVMPEFSAMSVVRVLQDAVSSRELIAADVPDAIEGPTHANDSELERLVRFAGRADAYDGLHARLCQVLAAATMLHARVEDGRLAAREPFVPPPLPRWVEAQEVAAELTDPDEAHRDVAGNDLRYICCAKREGVLWVKRQPHQVAAMSPHGFDDHDFTRYAALPPQEAWELLAARGLLPGGWVENPQRRFVWHTGAERAFPETPWECVLLASHVPDLLTAEALARELGTRGPDEPARWRVAPYDERAALVEHHVALARWAHLGETGCVAVGVERKNSLDPRTLVLSHSMLVSSRDRCELWYPDLAEYDEHWKHAAEAP